SQVGEGLALGAGAEGIGEAEQVGVVGLAQGGGQGGDGVDEEGVGAYDRLHGPPPATVACYTAVVGHAAFFGSATGRHASAHPVQRPEHPPRLKIRQSPVFRNRRGDRIKLLYWDTDGYVIVYKRLEVGIFRFPTAAEGQASVTVRAAELAMLLDGVDWQSAKRSKRYHRPATATG